MTKPRTPIMHLVEYDQDSWGSKSVKVEEALNLLSEGPRHRFFFANSKAFLDCEDLRLRLSAYLGIPQVFWTPLCSSSNGFFGAQNCHNNDGQIKRHNTWFRFIVKRFKPMQSTYSWFEMSFFTTWTAGSMTSFCFDVPKTAQIRIHHNLASRAQSIDLEDVYANHVILLDEILVLYDESVWALRDGLRQIEKGREKEISLEGDYPFLHVFARHAIHSTEILDVALDTVDQIIEQQHLLKGKTNGEAPQEANIGASTEGYLHFQRQMLKGLRARSKANQLRLKNEINFAFNIATQIQSDTLVSINKGTKDDGAVMRAVAVVTLIFLPATFVSALFSMTFFNFSPGTDSQPEILVVSKDFWIYWSVTIPLTVVTIASWFFWRRWQRGHILGKS